MVNLSHKFSMRTGAGDPFLSLHPNSAPAVRYGCSRNIDCETGLAKWMDIDTVSLVDAKSGHGETLNAGDIDSDTWLASPVMCMSACEGVNEGGSALSPRLVYGGGSHAFFVAVPRRMFCELLW